MNSSEHKTAKGAVLSRHMLDFKGGGFWLVVAGLMMAGVAAWRVAGIVKSWDTRALGDGKNVASYQFDLSPCLVPQERIVATGLSRDGLPALMNPPVVDLAEAEKLKLSEHDRFLRSGDRVIGVEINGEARAYPLRIMNWHEVVNDTLGGQPIAVTYSMVCDSAVVFDRRVAGETLEFRMSGLLYNSNLLLYDRRPNHQGESLWSQLQFRAIAGPAAAAQKQLRVLPAVLARWSDWKERYPRTTTLKPEAERMLRYKEDPYVNYMSSDQLRFFVAPLPDRAERPYKSPVVAVRWGTERWNVFALADLAKKAAADGVFSAGLDGRTVRFQVYPDPLTVFAQSDPPTDDFQIVNAFWFAWYAMHPDEAVLAP